MPKVMIPVGNRPILEHVVRALAGCAVRDITIVVGYQRERIMSHFGDGGEFGVRVDYATQERQLGTGQALSLVPAETLGEEFLLLPGDNLVDSPTLRGFLKEAAAGGGPALLVARAEAASKYGVVELDGDRVLELVEKPSVPKTHVVATGICLLDSKAAALAREQVSRGTHELSAVLNFLAEGGGLRAVRTAGLWADAVYPWDLIKLNQHALDSSLEGKAGKIESGCTVKGKVLMGKGSLVRSGTYIEGPAVIGEGCEIGPNVTILPATSIGANVVVGPHTVVKNSLVMDSAAVGAFSYLERSVVGEGARVGTHFSASSGGAHVQSEDGFHEVLEIGGIVGTGAVVKDHVSVDPGVVLGYGAHVSSFKRLSRNVGEGARVE
jgi:glucose-1-phosphate thymidylyltransferase